MLWHNSIAFNGCGFWTYYNVKSRVNIQRTFELNQTRVLVYMSTPSINQINILSSSATKFMSFCQICHLAAQMVQKLSPSPKVLVLLVHLKNGDNITVEVKTSTKLVLYTTTSLSDLYLPQVLLQWWPRLVVLFVFFTLSMHLGSRWSCARSPYCTLLISCLK